MLKTIIDSHCALSIKETQVCVCELIYYHAIIIFCICLVQNCLSQVKISETVCKSVWVLKLSVLKRTDKHTFIHPWERQLINIKHV